jgi:hypothetical protein
MSKKKSRAGAEQTLPAGWVESIEFDPRTGMGHAAVCSYSKDGKLIDVTREFFDAGGVMRWDSDLRSMSLIDRYREARAKIIEKCPKGYPLGDVILVGKDASPGRVRRMQHDSAARLIAYLQEHNRELEDIFSKNTMIPQRIS